MEEADKMKLALKRYLGQYYRAKRKKNQLEKRLRVFREEMGVKGMQYSGMPGSGSKTSSDTEEQVIRAMEIEERITKQQTEIQRAMLAVIDIMDYLPLDSTERLVLEYRHIDCLDWKEIPARASYSKASCHKYYNMGIDKLLEFTEVEVCVKKYLIADK